MEWGKLDAALAAALGDRRKGGAIPLTVLIELADDVPELARDTLGALGVRGELPQEGCSARLSADQVAMLSDQPWVRRLRLATTLRLHSDHPP
ncbi:MAG TPA: hypothetical protein VNA57_11015 [Acidimicrobiales bacterium]|nr:hypothetical protein [Acidimicrobiales bacterium]